MKTYLKPKSVSHNNAVRTRKPLWSINLSILWKEARRQEHIFTKLKHDDIEKPESRANFILAQNKNDKALRKDKRKYALKDAQTLVISEQENAHCFWNIINSLKTRKACNIHIDVYINGQLTWTR